MAMPYEVFIHLKAENGVSGVLGAISAQVLGLRGNVAELTKGFSALRLGVLGAVGVGAGLGVFAVLKDASKYAKDLSHELTQIQKLNISQGDFQRVQDSAWGVTRSVPGTSYVDALKALGSAYSMFGTDGAIRLMKPISEFAQVVGNTGGDYEAAEKTVYSMIRAGDLMGKFMNEATHQVDTDRLQHFLDIGSQSMLLSHGKVNSATWLALAQQGGPALSQLSDEGLRTMAIAAQAMGGNRAGTALTSFYSQMVGGRMAQFQAQQLHDLGLVGGFTPGKGGNIQWHTGALDTPFSQALRENPFKAVEILKDALEKHGKLTIDQQVPELFKILGRQTTQRLVHDILRNMPQIAAESARMEGALGIKDAMGLQNSQDMVQNEQNMTAAWNNLMYAVAGPAAGSYVSAIQTVTNALNSLTQWAQGVDPGVIQGAFRAFGTMGAGLFTAGTLAIIAAMASALGPAGPLILGLVALAGVIGALSAYFHGPGTSSAPQGVEDPAKAAERARANRSAITNFFDDLSAVLASGQQKLNDAVKAIGSALGAAIMGIPGMVAGAISSMAAAIGAAISGALHFGFGGGGGSPAGAAGALHGMPMHPSGLAPSSPFYPRQGGSSSEGHVFLDGNKVGSVIWRRTNVASGYASQAPAFDTYAHFVGGDNAILAG